MIFQKTLRSFILFLFAVTLLSSAAAAQVAPASAAQDNGTELALQDLNGARASLSEYRGRVVVLNFWATWCVPCREEMPILVNLRKRYAARGVEIIGASADDASTEAQIPSFIREAKINFPIWKGATIADMQRFGLGSALPATAVIDRDGQIVGRILGPVTTDDLRQRIEWLLGDRRTQAPAPLVNNIEQHRHADGDRHEHEGEAEDKDAHAHEEGEEEHEHGGVGIEGASTVPS